MCLSMIGKCNNSRGVIVVVFVLEKECDSANVTRILICTSAYTIVKHIVSDQSTTNTNWPEWIQGTAKPLQMSQLLLVFMTVPFFF